MSVPREPKNTSGYESGAVRPLSDQTGNARVIAENTQGVSRLVNLTVNGKFSPEVIKGLADIAASRAATNLSVQATAPADEVREKIENVGIAIVGHDVRKYISLAAALTTNGQQK